MIPALVGRRRLRAIALWATAACLALTAAPAWAGPPFLTDDPEPAPERHYEIYLYAEGGSANGQFSGETGIDFNYGAGPDLQLTATVPLAFQQDAGEPLEVGLGNIELGAKFRIAHQDTAGLDIAVFPTLILPATSDIGENHASLFLPVWLERDGENWSVFGGGGCALNRGGDSQDYCLAGIAVTREIRNFEIGAELFHQGADARDEAPSTVLGFGLTYELNERVHFLSYAGAQLEHRAENGSALGYTSLLFTF